MRRATATTTATMTSAGESSSRVSTSTPLIGPIGHTLEQSRDWRPPHGARRQPVSLLSRSMRDWPSTVEVAPSILSADFGRMREQIGEVLDAGARVIHIDV